MLNSHTVLPTGAHDTAASTHLLWHTPILNFRDTPRTLSSDTPIYQSESLVFSSNHVITALPRYQESWNTTVLSELASESGQENSFSQSANLSKIKRPGFWHRHVCHSNCPEHCPTHPLWLHMRMPVLHFLSLRNSESYGKQQKMLSATDPSSMDHRYKSRSFYFLL